MQFSLREPHSCMRVCLLIKYQLLKTGPGPGLRGPSDASPKSAYFFVSFTISPTDSLDPFWTIAPLFNLTASALYHHSLPLGALTLKGLVLPSTSVTTPISPVENSQNSVIFTIAKQPSVPYTRSAPVLIKQRSTPWSGLLRNL